MTPVASGVVTEFSRPRMIDGTRRLTLSWQLYSVDHDGPTAFSDFSEVSRGDQHPLELIARKADQLGFAAVPYAPPGELDAVALSRSTPCDSEIAVRYGLGLLRWCCVSPLGGYEACFECAVEIGQPPIYECSNQTCHPFDPFASLPCVAQCPTPSPTKWSAAH
jgi:hypothetical protein